MNELSIWGGGRRAPEICSTVWWNTSDRPRTEVDFNQRFPRLPRFHVRLDQRSVSTLPGLRLIRQNRASSLHARSQGGASGLMQLLPSTARFVASKIGMSDLIPARSATSIPYPSAQFLNMALHDLTGRMRWRPRRTTPPGPAAFVALALTRPSRAIFSEAIPFNETRGCRIGSTSSTSAPLSSLRALELAMPFRRMGVQPGKRPFDAVLLHALPLTVFPSAPATAISPNIRVSGDHFGRENGIRSCTPRALRRARPSGRGCDVFMSRQTANLLLAHLVSGHVGIGDRIAAETSRTCFTRYNGRGDREPATPLRAASTPLYFRLARPISPRRTPTTARCAPAIASVRPRIRSGERRHSRASGFP